MRRYFLRKEWKASLRARPVLTVLVVLFAAGGIAGMAILHLGLDSVSRWWESQFLEPQLELFLDPALATDRVLTLAGQLGSLRQVQNVHYASAEEARREAEIYLGPLAFSVLPENPLPPSIRLTLKPTYWTARDTRRLVDSLITVPGVSEVVSAEERIAAYTRGRGIIDRYRDTFIATALLWVAGWLFVGIFLVLRVRADHAKIWQYLGVPPGWLRWPPIAEGLTLGTGVALVGALLASLAAQHTLGEIGRTPEVGEYAVLLAVPPVAGVLAGWLAYRVHRRRVLLT